MPHCILANKSMCQIMWTCTRMNGLYCLLPHCIHCYENCLGYQIEHFQIVKFWYHHSTLLSIIHICGIYNILHCRLSISVCCWLDGQFVHLSILATSLVVLSRQLPHPVNTPPCPSPNVSFDFLGSFFLCLMFFRVRNNIIFGFNTRAIHTTTKCLRKITAKSAGQIYILLNHFATLYANPLTYFT